MVDNNGIDHGSSNRKSRKTETAEGGIRFFSSYSATSD